MITRLTKVLIVLGLPNFRAVVFILCHCVSIFLNWLREQFCNLSLYMLYVLSVE